MNSGLPAWIDEVQGYLVGIERAMKVQPSLLLPNHGRPSPRGSWTLQSAMRWSNNFLTNLTSVLGGGATVVEIVERDVGRGLEPGLEDALRLVQIRPYLRELERTRAIRTDGTGWSRKWGVNIQDPNAQLRPW